MNIYASIASSDLLNLKDEIDFVDKRYGHIHIDIEDGNYIPNITFGTKLMERVCEVSTSSKSIHLMVTSPELYIDSIVRCKSEIAFLHLDNQRYPSQLIRRFQDAGVRVGIAINPNISVEDIRYIIPLVNDVLVMMCEPDGRGQWYMKSMETKIIALVAEGKVKVWVDGDINLERLEGLKKLGVSAAIMGRAIFQDKRASISV